MRARRKAKPAGDVSTSTAAIAASSWRPVAASLAFTHACSGVPV
ncbi:hypothetical protein NAEX_04819 [Nannocystis exedens]|nr:hypothetical protein NAEX_04819 [Nannocystis exedens]